MQKIAECFLAGINKMYKIQLKYYLLPAHLLPKLTRVYLKLHTYQINLQEQVFLVIFTQSLNQTIYSTHD